MNAIVMLNVEDEIANMVDFLKDTFSLKIGRQECRKVLKSAYDEFRLGVANAGVGTETSTLKMFVDNRLMMVMRQLETPLNCAMDAEFVALNKIRMALKDSQLERNVKQGKSQRKMEKAHKGSFKQMGHATFNENVSVAYKCQFKTLKEDLTYANCERKKAELGWNLKKQILRAVFKQLLQVACHEAAESVKRDVLRIQSEVAVLREKGEAQVHEVKMKDVARTKFVRYAVEAFSMRGAVNKKTKTAMIKKMVSSD